MGSFTFKKNSSNKSRFIVFKRHILDQFSREKNLLYVI